MLSVFLFSFAISIDAFSLAIGFGVKGLNLNFFDCVFINIINSFSLLSSILFSRAIFINYNLNEIVFVGCCFLLFLGFYNIINYFLDRNKIERKNDIKIKKIDKVSIIALLCLESVVSGFSLLAFTGDILLLVFLSFVLHTMFLFWGIICGKSMHKGINLNTDWLSGVIFIMLAASKFFT